MIVLQNPSKLKYCDTLLRCYVITTLVSLNLRQLSKFTRYVKLESLNTFNVLHSVADPGGIGGIYLPLYQTFGWSNLFLISVLLLLIFNV